MNEDLRAIQFWLPADIKDGLLEYVKEQRKHSTLAGYLRAHFVELVEAHREFQEMEAKGK